ncbi:hypothetical protein SELMODRAFT_422116 [Selaginella moellendorffii]|uniref:Isopenicillin N synthase-like Fe(2+) 2OG dioxygenase domain-containing protein n=1 Tax=Selaginella moellendorffii TaxID=88036 RepID=D8SHE0_SELML|nr:hypothetical protein SELMODRAFT_422116 [Selaginella moellendorffii]
MKMYLTRLTQASNPEEGLFGAGVHSDYGMLTLLASGGIPGLQMCKMKDPKEQIWTNVQPLKGAFVVNLGDMLESWTNNLFRIVMDYFRQIAFFMGPNFDCIVEYIPTCCSELNPSKFPPVKSGDHLLGRYKVTHKDWQTENGLLCRIQFLVKDRGVAPEILIVVDHLLLQGKREKFPALLKHLCHKLLAYPVVHNIEESRLQAGLNHEISTRENRKPTDVTFLSCCARRSKSGQERSMHSSRSARGSDKHRICLFQKQKGPTSYP